MLVRHGYRGPVWCTPGTSNLLHVLLADAAHLQEEDAVYANEKGYSKHHPALPLFDRRDAAAALALLRTVPYDQDLHPAPGVSARFRRAGHIIGAARIELAHQGRTLVFSGDVGRADDLLLKPPDPLGSADWIVVESTYGDRLHDRCDPLEALEHAIGPVIQRGGVVMVPCFTVGRAQTVLHLLAKLKGERRIPDLPVYLDSPMAIEATRIYHANDGDHRISDDECRALCAVAEHTRTAEESRRLNRLKGPFVVLAGSGMVTGGRILHHLKLRGGDPNNAILLKGFQAAGTRGRSLAEGARELKMHGRMVPIRADVIELGGLSGHADAQGLLSWLQSAPQEPRRVFVNHGEPLAATALAASIQKELGWDAHVPAAGESIQLERPSAPGRR